MTLSKEDGERLDRVLAELREHASTELGYPSAFDIDYRPLEPFLGFSLNNVGDPFRTGSYRLNSHEFEREVLEFFASLTHAPEDGWWGYVTNGGTEGNLYGMYLARELYPDGIVYFSRDSHYSVAKNLHFLGMRNIMIRSLENGEMDYEDLRETIRIRRDAPPIIFANIGTTMTEGRDDIGIIREILDDMAVERRYIHSDAALCGGYAAFLDPRPAWDFSDGADSIAISGHKFLASPIPCGIVLARKQYVERIGQAVAYIGSRDTTISGSRNGFTPILLWYAIRRFGEEGMRRRLEHAMAVADYAEERFREAGIDAHRNRGALTVVFPKPPRAVRDKWQLATAGDISHIICMPQVTREQVDLLLADMLEFREDRP
ncbi:MAG: histidine decarboxylase [Gammaproteobacteria bacterium]